MPDGRAATRRAALAELRAALAGIRCAVQLLVRDVPPCAGKPLGWAILRAVSRGERALGRLEGDVRPRRPPSHSLP
jgi:nitrogen-specific signal transduction histidine kinase